MKAILNPKFQKNVVTIIEDSSNDEYLQAGDEKYHIADQTFGDIQEELMHTPDLIKETCKGKQKVVEFEVGTCSRTPVIEEDPAHQEVMK